MKANHNAGIVYYANAEVVVNISNSKNESKSQRKKGENTIHCSCAKYQ